MNVDVICDNVALKHKVSKVLVRKLFKAYWLFVKEKIKAMDFSKPMTEEEFETAKLSVNVPHIGRLACTWRMYIQINNDLKRIKEIRNGNNNQDKESDTIV